MTEAVFEEDVERLIGVYQEIEQASRDMLAAARDADWDRVAEIHEACSVLIDTVRRMNRQLEIGRDAQRAKLRIIRQIVRNEAQIRRLAYPWSERWEHLVFGSVGMPGATVRRH